MVWVYAALVHGSALLDSANASWRSYSFVDRYSRRSAYGSPDEDQGDGEVQDEVPSEELGSVRGRSQGARQYPLAPPRSAHTPDTSAFLEEHPGWTAEQFVEYLPHVLHDPYVMY